MDFYTHIALIIAVVIAAFIIWLDHTLRPPPRRQLQQLGRLHFQCLGDVPDDLQADIALARPDPS
jgi:hypothetical protein